MGREEVGLERSEHQVCFTSWNHVFHHGLGGAVAERMGGGIIII